MFTCWSGIVASLSGNFAGRLGEIARNTQIEQQKAVGKTYAAENRNKNEHQEGPGIASTCFFVRVSAS